MMKAVVCTKFGLDGLKLEDVPKPIPAVDEVLVRVHASSVNYNILAYASGKPVFARLMGVGFLKPKIKIPGGDIAGVIESVGKNVSRFQPGDKVFGNMDGFGGGAFAEYAAVPEKILTLKPAGISFEEAAVAIQAAIVAMQGLRYKKNIEPGQKVLIYGASGGIGTFAVQIAKAFGAEVTGVCSTANLALVQALGADHVIDYTKEDFTKNGQRYHRIMAIAGYHSIFDYKRALTPNGVYVMVGGSMKGRKAMLQIFQALFLGPLLSKKTGKMLGSLTTKSSIKDLVFIKRLIECRKVKSVIDRTYPLNEVTEALRYYEDRHARGKVAITI